MTLPTWAMGAVLVAGFLHVSQFFMDDAGMCESPTGLPGTDGDFIETLQAYSTFAPCGGESWFRYVLFTIGTLPLLLLLGIFLFQLFNNAVTGAVVGALAVVVGLIALFS